MGEAPTVTQRIRVSILVLALLLVAGFVLFRVVLALYAGEISISFRYGPDGIYSRTQDPATFYLWVFLGSALSAMLVAGSVAALILNWRRDGQYTKDLIQHLAIRSRTGVAPMVPEALPDGFRKSAEVHRAAAEKTTDPEAKAKLLKAADQMQAVHDKAQRVWADTHKTRHLVQSVLTPEHKTKGFWITVGIMCLIVAGLFFMRS